jgi:hypothetical protein
MGYRRNGYNHFTVCHVFYSSQLRLTGWDLYSTLSLAIVILHSIFGVKMYGVSPAYFFSRFTTDFTVRDYARGLDWLAESGFQGFQLEVFHRDRLGEWAAEASLLRARASSLGMTATQFVAHFLLYTTPLPGRL